MKNENKCDGCEGSSFGCEDTNGVKFCPSQPKAEGWRERICVRCIKDGHNVGACEGKSKDDWDTCTLLGVVERELARVHEQYKPVVDAIKARKAKLCDNCCVIDAVSCGKCPWYVVKSALAKLEGE